MYSEAELAYELSNYIEQCDIQTLIEFCILAGIVPAETTVDDVETLWEIKNDNNNYDL